MAIFQAVSTDSPTTSASLTSLRSAERWILNADAAMKNLSSFSQRVLLSLSVKEVNEAINRFANSHLSVRSVGCGHQELGICPREYAKAGRQLHDHICDFLVKTAFHASTVGKHLDLPVGLALLEKRNAGLPIISSCEFQGLPLSSASIARPSLFESGSTPQALTSSHDWRNRLVKELTRDAKYQYESIVKIVGDVCQDLERRCDDAEVPIRAEQIKTSGLMVELKTSQVRIAELESQVLERTQISEGLEIEKNCLQDQVQAFEQRVKILSSRLTQLEQQSCLAVQEAKNTAEAAHEATKQQELTYLASMAGKDELFEEQSTKLLDSQTHASKLQEELTQLRLQEANSEGKIRGLEEKLSERNEIIECLQATIASKEANSERLVELEARLTAENHKLRTEVLESPITSSRKILAHSLQSQKFLTERDNRVLELEVQIVDSRKDLSDVRKEHELYSSAKAVEVCSKLNVSGAHGFEIELDYVDLTDGGMPQCHNKQYEREA